MSSPVDGLARALWFDFVDQQGYPNGLPSWDEMAAWPATDRNNRCDEFRSIARAALVAMIEPSEHMKQEACDTVVVGCCNLDLHEAEEIWRTMINAALNSPQAIDNTQGSQHE